MAFGIDYAWGRPGIPAMKKTGVKFVVRYLSYDRTGKNLSAEEVKALRAAGIDIVVVWESGAARALDGFNAGVSDAREARRLLRKFGVIDVPIYFAVDFDASASHQARINAYLRGAASVHGRDRTGVYGGYWVVKRVLDAGIVKYAWQTYAWSGGKWDARAHIQQFWNGRRLNGHDVDFDRSTKADFGQWRRPKPQSKPKPKPKPKPKSKVDPTVRRLLRWWRGRIRRHK